MTDTATTTQLKPLDPLTDFPDEILLVKGKYGYVMITDDRSAFELVEYGGYGVEIPATKARMEDWTTNVAPFIDALRVPGSEPGDNEYYATDHAVAFDIVREVGNEGPNRNPDADVILSRNDGDAFAAMTAAVDGFMDRHEAAMTQSSWTFAETVKLLGIPEESIHVIRVCGCTEEDHHPMPGGIMKTNDLTPKMITTIINDLGITEVDIKSVDLDTGIVKMLNKRKRQLSQEAMLELKPPAHRAGAIDVGSQETNTRADVIIPATPAVGHGETVEVPIIASASS